MIDAKNKTHIKVNIVAAHKKMKRNSILEITFTARSLSEIEPK